MDPVSNDRSEHPRPSQRGGTSRNPSARSVAGTRRFQKDLTMAARYDFNPYLYAKFEQHFLNGAALGFNASDNPDMQPTTRMTILKLGVSF